MEVVKNGFVDFAPTVSVRRRAHSADPSYSEMVPFESADLFRETPQGEPICPSHPFCIPCMNTEGRYCGPPKTLEFERFALCECFGI